MGISSYYEIVPQGMLTRLASDADVLSAFDCMWGYGSGMYSWFDEIDGDELDEITSEQSPAAVQALRELLASAQSFPSAYIEKTHEAHETMLTSAFAAAGERDPGKLASTVVYGAEEWGHDTELNIVAPDCSRSIAQAMTGLVARDIIATYDLGDRTPVPVWRDDLTRELEDLIECYRVAAQLGHPVLVGVV